MGVLVLQRRIRGATFDARLFPSWICVRQLLQQTRITKRFRSATTTRRCNTRSVGLDINRMNTVVTVHGMPTVSSPCNKVAHQWWAAEWRVAPSL